MTSEQHLQDVQEIMSKVEYRPDKYRFRVEIDANDPEGRVFLQIQCFRPDTYTGEMSWGGGGKSYLSPHMTPSEIVRRALGAALAYEEHEVREAFKWEGRRIFGPHIDINALWEVADKLDVRP